MTTNQIKTLITSSSIAADAQISKKEKSGFGAIGSYAEFGSSFTNKDITGKAKAKGKKYDGLYEQIEKADACRRKWGWVTRMFKGIGDFIIGIFWIALILLIVGIAGWFAYTYYLR